MKKWLLVGLLLCSSTSSAYGYYGYGEPPPWRSHGYPEGRYTRPPYPMPQYRYGYRYPLQYRYEGGPRWMCNWNSWGAWGCSVGFPGGRYPRW